MEDEGPRGASIARVAERAGVSIATVSRVVNGVGNKASPETVARVQAAIRDLGWRPTTAGRSLRQRQSRLVALIAANLANPAMTAIAASVETALRAADLSLVLTDSHDRPDLQDEHLLQMRAHQVRAAVLLGAVDSPVLAAMVAAREPLVFLNRRCPVAGETHYIGIDNRAAGRDVARFFLARGVTDVAILRGHVPSSATQDRVEGIRAGFAEAGHPLADDRIHTTAGAEHLEIGAAAVGRMLEAGALPKGLACASDMIAFGAYARLAEAGRTGDVLPHIMGFDDNPLNRWIAPWLSSVRIPYAAFGDALAATIARPDFRASGSTTILPHVLVDRTGG